MKYLEGKIAFITGASSGMGKDICYKFAEEGATVILGARSEAKCKAIAEDIEAKGGKARFYGPLDVTSQENIKSIVDQTIAEFGRIDVAALFAGGFMGGMTPEERYQKIMDVNMTGVYHCAMAVVPYMKEQKSGSIIICSSNGAFNPTSAVYDYHMAKGACESLTINLAFDLADSGVRVNCIKPGAIVTEFWDEVAPAGPERDALLAAIGETEVPLGRTGVAADISGPALFFASDALSGYITGQLLYVGGGLGTILGKNQTMLARMHPEEY